ncbi:MFS transporter [Pseudomaricurvus alkylphenolicus]|uniref:spinster family MFS transporter n=1 Tax=Pseudomaricurvus alkylphenolicus TaxID=1306991 RepID=UPI00141ED486|nr:MFS transporter [Pseudomaricurvus alkylphenolicus]NIB42662.1 MFS transporter [Pseudomaricurvus alkylphenolicus]
MTEGVVTPRTQPLNATPRTLSNRYTVLLVLGLVNLFNYMDRNLFSVLLEPIKTDMQFSDSQLGVLGGFSFALCYAIFGLLLGRLADRKNRVWILSICIGVWSLASAACGLVRNFTDFFLARVGVGIGEAGCVPAAHSLIGDYFRSGERAFAVSVFTGVGMLGSILGVVMGAMLADVYGWRAVFLIFGLPGVLLAFCLVFLVVEPPRGRLQPVSDVPSPTSFLDASLSLLRKRTVRYLLWGIPLYYFIIGGAGIWIPSFYLRIHGVSIGEYGPTGGLSIGLGYLLGTVAGGVLVSRLIVQNHLWEFWLPALAAVLSVPFYAVALTVDHLHGSYAVMFLAALVAGSGVGPSMSTLQIVAEPAVRALAIGFMLLSTSIISYGFGPLFVGVGSDLLVNLGIAANEGESLRIALLMALTAPLFAAVLFWVCSKTVRNDLAIRGELI